MADDEHSTPGSVPDLVQEFLGQLRAAAGLPSTSPGTLPLPGGLSAAQMASITDSIAAQRRSIEALQTQLPGASSIGANSALPGSLGAATRRPLWGASQPNMVNGPSYKHEQVQRPIDQETGPAAPGTKAATGGRRLPAVGSRHGGTSSDVS
jgi:hypothetical protein